MTRDSVREEDERCDGEAQMYHQGTPGYRWRRVVGLLLLSGASFGCRPDHQRSPAPVEQSDCVLCHQPEYETTEMPPHPGLFETTCGDCHLQTAWVPASPIRHDAFALRQRHLDASCVGCHTEGFRPGDTSSECLSCHQADRDRATMPEHTLYPDDCSMCHDEAGWRPSTFAHTPELTGAHITTGCTSCHGQPPVWTGIPTACVGCHQDDYDNSPFPGHQTFRVQCEDCHTTSAWTPAIGDTHPEARFPITSGAHSEHRACLGCHNAELGPSTDGANTDCVGCHVGEHNRADVDDDHSGVSDYPFSTTSVNFCLDCHPDGRD